MKITTTTLSILASLLLLSGCDALGPGDLDSEQSSDNQTLKEDTSYLFQIPKNGSDAGEENFDDTDATEDNPLTIIELPKYGSLELQPEAALYIPNPDYFGEDSFKVNYVDYDTGRSTTYTVPLTVLPVNDAPTISGTPPTQISASMHYSFMPIINDVDNARNTLVIKAENLPSWATFNASSGEISGNIPSDAEGMTYSNITLSVSDGTDTTTLEPWSVSVGSSSSSGTASDSEQGSSSSDEGNSDDSTSDGVINNPNF